MAKKCPKCNNKKTLVKTSRKKFEGVLVVPLNNHKLSANEIRYCDKCDTYFNDNQISSGQAKRPTNRNTWKKVNTNKKVFESGG